ncbi:MAG: MBL fold metallo-hydrolase [Porticoccaceae bacterium]
MARISHHGAVTGVTGSCHQLHLPGEASLLVDCGLFQGAESSDAENGAPVIDFSIAGVRALVVTHCHVDHCGRIPWLLAAGFTGPIYATEATARLLPMVLEDALKVGVTRNQSLLDNVLARLARQLVGVPYRHWFQLVNEEGVEVRGRFQVAGHILGSAYVECDVRCGAERERVVFSGDLGAPWTPLLPAPKPPSRADTLVIESTYGDSLHEGRRQRRKRLREVIEHCYRDGGVVLIPAFSIGRTQELLYEIETLIHSQSRNSAPGALSWRDVAVIVDSPLAADFTRAYVELRALWDAEALGRTRSGRHPLSFEQLLTVNSHDDHLRLVNHFRATARPAIVIAASGMCAGGRIVNYLKALLPDPRTDVIFVGYQARGTPGRDIQHYGPKGGYVVLDGERVNIRAGVHTLSGYSAHADQGDLVRFVKGIRKGPSNVRIVHGDEEAKQALAARLRRELPAATIDIPG